MDMPMVDLGVLPCELDAGIAHRAAIGLLVLASDQTMEHEFRHLVRQDGVALYEARLYSDNAITPATLRAMGERIARSKVTVLSGCGHWTTFEKPAECAEELRAFYKSMQ